QTAREMLGMDKVKEDSRVLKQEKSESEGMYASASDNHICDECGFFDAENNQCTVIDEERRFDQAACRQFMKAEAGLVTEDEKA
ncbi:MAG: hypothetical protein P9X24_10935, partial [Candidatus Hatepunaea meridiana]|nr:hypothetical protein [Candidatus Hatepunaea meridiana]